MKIKKISLGWIISSDAEKTKNFFSDVIGMRVTDSNPEFGWFELQGTAHDGIALGIGQYHQNHGADKPGQNAVLALEVDDLAQAKEELEKKGVSFIDDIIEIEGHVKMITFVDPDGNKFQLVQLLEIK